MIGICALDANKQKDAPNGRPLYAAFVFFDGHLLIAYKSSGPARAKDFYEVFFRAISRIDDGATGCVIAIAAQAEIGLPARARQHGSSWKRIGQAFPELKIWLVDGRAKTVRKTGWGDWASR